MRSARTAAPVWSSCQPTGPTGSAPVVAVGPRKRSCAWTRSTSCRGRLAHSTRLDGLSGTRLREARAAHAAKSLKGLRWLLVRNWENLSAAQKGVIRDLNTSNQPRRRHRRRPWRCWVEGRHDAAETVVVTRAILLWHDGTR